MDSPPKTPEELYAFFVPNITKPLSKPDYVCLGIRLNRPGWHLEIYGRPVDNAMIMWFYSHPNRDPKWVMSYDKFTDPSQDS